MLERIQRMAASREAAWPIVATMLAAAALSILNGVLSALGALVLLAWFGLPGFAYTRRMQDRTTALTAGLAAGWAASLVVIALAGTIIGRFHWSWILAAPGLLSLIAARFAPDGPAVPGQAVPSRPDPWLGASMLVGLALAWPALSHVGAITAEGVNFRPFFNADYFKHVGVAQGFLLGDFPPRDLFGHGGSVQYYWLQHVLPATLLAVLPGTEDPFKALGSIGGWQTVVLGALLYVWARRYFSSGGGAFLLVLVATASLSLDGLASFVASGRWLDPAQNFNMEPMDLTTSLFLTADRIHASTLYRLNLYIPQHQLCAIFIIAWFLSLPPRGGLDIGQWDRAALIAALPATSLLMGLPALVIIAMVLACSWFQDRRVPWIAAAAAAVGLTLPVITGMVSLGSSAVRLATATIPIVHEPTWIRLAWLPAQLVTSFGVMLALASAGTLAILRNRDAIGASATAPAIGLVICLAGYAGTIVALPPTFLLIDSQLKLSFVVGILMVPLAAKAIESGVLRSRRSWRIGLGVLLVLGLPSPVHDTRWHACETRQCRSNPWQSTTLPTADWQALQWIRQNTPPEAVFQQSPEPDFLAGGRDVWIPVVAGRRIHASRRGSHASPTDIQAAEMLFEPDQGASRSGSARDLGVQYLYLSRTLQGGSFAALSNEFARDSGLTQVFSNGDVSVWHVMDAT